MKRLSLVTTISVAIALPNLAQAANNDSATISMKADVAPTCYFTGAATEFAGATTAAPLDFSTQIDSTTAILTPAAKTVTATAYCNDNGTTLTMVSANAGFLNSSPPSAVTGTFANTAGNSSLLSYTATGDWGGTLTAFPASTTESGSLLPANPGAINDTITVDITLAAQTDPVLAGSYADTLTVKIATAP